MNCVIIDDEPLAREGLANYVRAVDFLNLTDLCEDAVALNSILNEKNIDLIFLDIQMPWLTGIDFLRTRTHNPITIITTAYPTFAVESFQLDVLDYLLKPITFDRFFKAAKKACDYHSLLNNGTGPKPSAGFFFIKTGQRHEKVVINEILFIEARQNYVTIHTETGKYMTLMPLKNIEAWLNPEGFVRVHKSFIVAISKIGAIENNEVLIASYRIPVSRNYKPAALDRILGNTLLNKNTDKIDRP